MTLLSATGSSFAEDVSADKAEMEGAHPVPPPGHVLRVGGDLQAEATWNGARGEWRSGDSRIDTPLPEGYPAPTPPGAIDIKTYPLVRRAEISGSGGRSNSGFMPLFRHIQRNQIAMTSPVEMDYETGEATTARTDRWTMSFLYRTQELGGTGTDPHDQRITVRDIEPVTVVSLGGRGSYANSRIESDLNTLTAWLAENPDWLPAGPPRALLYNGPSWTPWANWLEVHIPVRWQGDEPVDETSSPETEAD